MITRVQRFIAEKNLFSKQHQLLLAVSGGSDSMAMLHLFHSLNYRIGVAHCNFQLRGKESDLDEKVVADYCEKYGIPFFSVRFETDLEAQKRKCSIQMAARDLRYSWLEKMRIDNGYAYILTAHHADDDIETILLNFSRGSGYKGLSGMAAKHDMLVRPFLQITKAEINEYLTLNHIPWRHDESNSNIHYRRNFIRHELIPTFEKINPAFRSVMTENISFLKESRLLIEQQLSRHAEKIIEKRGIDKYIPIKQILKSAYPQLLLHHILQAYGFTSTQCGDVFRSLNALSGKQFRSPSFLLVKDRAHLILSEAESLNTGFRLLDEAAAKLKLKDGELSWKRVSMLSSITPDHDSICVDASLLEWPLHLRRWQKGDYFYPLGMEKKKKLSRFFIDQKIPLHQKERIWLLFSKSKLVWILGLRMDNRFRVKPNTTELIKFSFKQD